MQRHQPRFQGRKSQLQTRTSTLHPRKCGFTRLQTTFQGRQSPFPTCFNDFSSGGKYFARPEKGVVAPEKWLNSSEKYLFDSENAFSKLASHLSYLDNEVSAFAKDLAKLPSHFYVLAIEFSWLAKRSCVLTSHCSRLTGRRDEPADQWEIHTHAQAELAPRFAAVAHQFTGWDCSNPASKSRERGLSMSLRP